MTGKLAWLGGCSHRRAPVVHRRQERVVGAGSVYMLGLQCRGRAVLLVGRCFFRRRWPCGDSTSSAVIADVVERRVVDDGFAVNIVNVRDIHVACRAVIVERSAVPISALITETAIAEAVVDAAVKADTPAPIAFIPGVGVVTPAPVTRRPEQTLFGSLHPRAWNPEVAFVSIRPIAGRPQITVGGAHGLGIYRESRRRNRDRHADLRERGGRYG